MDATAPTPAEQVAGIVDGLKRAIAAWAAKHPASAPLILLLWNRLSGMVRRLAAIAANPTPRPRPRRPAAQQRKPRKPYRRLPGGQAWLIRLVPGSVAFGSQLRHLLAQPEMADLLAAAPRAGRVLRPLCRMLGVAPLPAALTPPPRPARPCQPPARKSAAHRPSPTVPPRAPPRQQPPGFLPSTRGPPPPRSRPRHRPPPDQDRPQ